MKYFVRLFSTILLVAISLFLTYGTAFASGGEKYRAKPLALASVTCSGNGCTHTDPYSTGCASTRNVVQSRDIIGVTGNVIGRIELEYSTTCGTNWAELFSYLPINPSNILDARIERLSGPDGPDTTEEYSSAAYSNIYTYQLYSYTNKSQACGRINLANQNPYPWQCTDAI